MRGEGWRRTAARSILGTRSSDGTQEEGSFGGTREHIQILAPPVIRRDHIQMLVPPTVPPTAQGISHSTTGSPSPPLLVCDREEEVESGSIYPLRSTSFLSSLELHCSQHQDPPVPTQEPESSQGGSVSSAAASGGAASVFPAVGRRFSQIDSTRTKFRALSGW
jgi:hypothetical protein